MTTETSNTIAKTLISPVLMKRNDCSIPQKNKNARVLFMILVLVSALSSNV